jgi:hypothetical protein
VAVDVGHGIAAPAANGARVTSINAVEGAIGPGYIRIYEAHLCSPCGAGIGP